ncbi:MAG: N-acetylmuramoyl-L-alanine amidase [Acidobacteriota bacterium]
MPEPRNQLLRARRRDFWRRLTVALGLTAVMSAPCAAVRRVALDAGMSVVLSDEKIFLEVAPRPGEATAGLAQRVSSARDATRQFTQANRGVKELRADLRYRVPYAMLTPALQVKAVKALFPADRLAPTGWRHTTRGEGLWRIAEWFAGDGKKFAAIRKANSLKDDPRTGQVVLIPSALLTAGFRTAKSDDAVPVAAVVPRVRPAPAVAPAKPLPSLPEATVRAADLAPQPLPLPDSDASSVFPTTATPYRLTYGHDEQGDYAVYELKAKEALYSSVVVRFTGRTLADDVNATALEVAKRNGIFDVTSMAIGYPVKIPLDLLQPEFLPPGHARRLEYEAALSASNKFKNQVTALDLEGITVVLDAGHGGIDTGAAIGGVWESTYVYDIALRVKTLLETYTAAHVVPTTRDGDRFRVEDRDVLSYSRLRAVLTTPAYPIQDSKVGVNLRWYIANSVQKAALRGGGDAERTVFVSVHADSLHPSLRGAMVYIPDAAMSGDAFERNGPEYSSRREVRDSPSADQPRSDRVRSEGLSRELAGYVVRAMKDEGLQVDPFKPVREKVIRNRREWVPAVLRYNVVPAKVLVEVCNLGNSDDRALIQTRAFRQKMAESIVRGLREYYGKSGTAGAPGQIAKAAGRR